MKEIKGLPVLDTSDHDVKSMRSVVAAIAIRSLAAQMLCGLALTAKPR